MKLANFIPMVGGDEHDALTRWRYFLRWKPGQRKAAKRSYSRRQRATAKQELRHEI